MYAVTKDSSAYFYAGFTNGYKECIQDYECRVIQIQSQQNNWSNVYATMINKKVSR